MLIIHGDNQVASRSYLFELKKGKSVTDLDGQGLALSDLTTAIQSTSLFGETNSIFIEDFFSRRPSNEKKHIIDYLLTHSDSDITIWESKDVSIQLKPFPPQIIKKFDLPKFIFSFLDHPDISSFHKVISASPVEMVFASLVTRAYKQAKTKWLADLLQIDYAQKTSKVPYDLTTALELWLTGI